MTTSLQDFETMLSTVKKFTFFDDSGHTFSVELDPVTQVTPTGIVMTVWKSEDKSIQLCHAAFKARGGRTIRALCIACKTYVMSPDVGQALAEIFMPDDTVSFELRPFKPGWPMALVVSDYPSVIRPAMRRPEVE